MGRMFGTDGVRGKANKELTAELAFKLGRAACGRLKNGSSSPKFVIGRDTRISGNMFDSALSAGIMSCGGSVISAGIIPTPAIPIITRYFQADAGIVISASHNPYYDNGIKFFNSQGLKLTDEIEDEIQAIIENNSFPVYATNEHIGSISFENNAEKIYLDYLFEAIKPYNLNGMKIVLDCANGATVNTSPSAFKKTGAETVVINNSPDGININHECGSTHINSLVQSVLSEKADLGIAFDGDGDRLIAVDEKGNVINGDIIMYLFAQYFKEKKCLAKDTVVLTGMSNLGLLKALELLGLKYKQTNVGDRYILQEILAQNYNFGGEQSGHIILYDINTTGDGLASALMLTKIIKEKDSSLFELTNKFKTYPQVLVNVKVKTENKLMYQESAEVSESLSQLNRKYDGCGRILLRHSGTEPLVRIMIEGSNEEEIKKDAQYLADIIKKISE